MENCELGTIPLSQKITPMQIFVWNTVSLWEILPNKKLTLVSEKK